MPDTPTTPPPGRHVLQNLLANLKLEIKGRGKYTPPPTSPQPEPQTQASPPDH